MTNPKLINSGPSPASLHRIALVLRCPQLYAFHYLAGVRGRRNALVRGSLTHVGTAHHYRRMMAVQRRENPDEWHKPVDAVEIAAQLMREEQTPQPVIDAEKETALHIVKAYERVLPQESEAYEILNVEEIVWFQIGGRWYTQRADLIRRHRATGKIRITDHKSTRSHNTNTFSGFGPSLQMLGYRWWGPQVFQDQWGGVEVNVLSAEPPYRVECRMVPGAPMLVRRFPQIVMDAEAMIDRLIAEQRPYDQWPAAADELICVHRYGRCEAWDMCLWGKEERQHGLVPLPNTMQIGDSVSFGGSKT